MEKETLKKANQLYADIYRLERALKEIRDKQTILINREGTSTYSESPISVPPDIALTALESYEERLKKELEEFEQKLKEL